MISMHVKALKDQIGEKECFSPVQWHGEIPSQFPIEYGHLRDLERRTGLTGAGGQY